MVSGVASPNAHGQATISSAMVWSIACCKPSRRHQTPSVAVAAITTTATNQPAARSVNCTIGGLARTPWSTNRISPPTRVASPTA